MTNPYEKYLIKSVNISSTQRKFITAMKTLMAQGKDHNYVNVSELCRAAKLSRPTFYANFQTVGDVTDAMQNEFLLHGSTLAAKFYKPHPDSDETGDFLREFMWYMLQKKDDFYCFLKGPNGPDQRFVEKWKRIIKYRFFDFFADRADYDFTLEVIASALVGGLTYYVSNPNMYTKQQFEESILHLYKVITTLY